MPLLHIWDSGDFRMRLLHKRTDAAKVISCADVATLLAALDALVSAGTTFDRVLFETHGGPGVIGFGDDAVVAATLRSWIPRQYTKLVTGNARVYFNGCNVAEGPVGWQFLEAAAALFLTPGGGEVFGHPSLGLANPFNGHVLHLWGPTRSIFVDGNGRVLEHFEQ
jgi:hypothetical protein